jgi:hypothetical protein
MERALLFATERVMATSLRRILGGGGGWGGVGRGRTRSGLSVLERLRSKRRVLRTGWAQIFNLERELGRT